MQLVYCLAEGLPLQRPHPPSKSWHLLRVFACSSCCQLPCNRLPRLKPHRYTDCSGGLCTLLRLFSVEVECTQGLFTMARLPYNAQHKLCRSSKICHCQSMRRGLFQALQD